MWLSPCQLGLSQEKACIADVCNNKNDHLLSVWYQTSHEMYIVRFRGDSPRSSGTLPHRLPSSRRKRDHASEEVCFALDTRARYT